MTACGAPLPGVAESVSSNEEGDLPDGPLDPRLRALDGV